MLELCQSSINGMLAMERVIDLDATLDVIIITSMNWGITMDKKENSMDSKEFFSDLELKGHEDDVVTLGTLLSCIDMLVNEITEALKTSSEYTDTRIDQLVKLIKKTNDEYIKKRFDMDLFFVMSYIEGNDYGWVQDYNKVAKTVFKEENK